MSACAIGRVAVPVHLRLKAGEKINNKKKIGKFSEEVDFGGGLQFGKKLRISCNP